MGRRPFAVIDSTSAAHAARRTDPDLKTEDASASDEDFERITGVRQREQAKRELAQSGSVEVPRSRRHNDAAQSYVALKPPSVPADVAAALSPSATEEPPALRRSGVIERSDVRARLDHLAYADETRDTIPAPPPPNSARASVTSRC